MTIIENKVDGVYVLIKRTKNTATYQWISFPFKRRPFAGGGYESNSLNETR